MSIVEIKCIDWPGIRKYINRILAKDQTHIT